MFKGWIGELKTGFNLWAGLDKNLYCNSMTSLFYRSWNNSIDHILVSPFGIFVVETKNPQPGFMGRQNNPLGPKLSTNPSTSFKTVKTNPQT